jgi:hypothetical protein
LSAQIKCLKCGDIIVSEHRHDFKYCSCKNVFIDGGGDRYTRYGGIGLDDCSFEIWNGEYWEPFGTMKMEEYYGISGDTKIGLVRRDRFKDPMYLDIRDIDPSIERYVWCYKPQVGFVSMKIEGIRKVNSGSLYKYKFQNNCGLGKGSFGTEDNIIATGNQQIMLINRESIPLMMIKDDIVLGIKRNAFNKIVYQCEAKLITTFKYCVPEFPSICDNTVYSLSVGSDDCFYDANGMFVKGF